jgi:small-conductance mechanosensitive channel
MALIRRIWTAREADEWTKEDLVTIIISPLIYFLLTIGVALSALLIPLGFLLLVLGILLIVVMVFIINPKLSVISEDYEKKQKKYLEELEKKVKWEE